MSTRSIVLLGLVVVVCLLVIAGSAFAREQLGAVFSPLPFREIPRLFRFNWPGAAGQPDVVRRSTGLLALGRSLISAAGLYIFLFLAGTLTLFAFPRQLRRVRDAYYQGPNRWLYMLGIGGFGALVLGLLSVLGVLTFAGIPLSLAVLAIFMLSAWGGLAGLALAAGRAVNRRLGLPDSSPLLDLAIGALVLFSPTRIPLAGAIFLVLIVLWALGAVLITRFGQGGVWSLAAFHQVEDSNP
jgi:hypothetical protein